MSRLVDFLIRDGVNDDKRTFDQTIAAPTSFWETSHSFIQWVFPSPEGSQNILTSPILSASEFHELKKEEFHLDQLVLAKKRFLRFLTEYRGWMGQKDHNHLRITRTIKCLSLFRGPDYAEDFMVSVLKLIHEGQHLSINGVSRLSKDFWADAIHYGEKQEFLLWK